MHYVVNLFPIFELSNLKSPLLYILVFLLNYSNLSCWIYFWDILWYFWKIDHPTIVQRWQQALRKNYDHQVSGECGSCVTLKFTRVYQIDDLAPAKLTVYPTMASSRAKEAHQQFFFINGTTLQAENHHQTTNGQ